MGAGDGAIFSRHTANAGGLSVSYLKGGTQRDVEPVLFLHGLGGGGKWESFHMAMGTVTLTLAPNLPGWQDGALPDGIAAPKDYAALAVKFLDSVGMDKVTVVGHSIGGWIAQYMAVEHPDRVARLVLIDAMGLDVPDAPSANLAALDEEAFAKAAFGRLGLIATAQAYGFGAEWQNIRQGPEFERQWKGRNLVVNLAKGTYADPGLTAKLRGLRAGTLLVWGKLDGIAPLKQGEAVHSWLPGSHLEVVDRAGHLPMVERPETMNRVIRDFLVGEEEPIEGVSRA